MNKPPSRLYFMDKMTAAEKLKLGTCEMEKLSIVDKFVFCRPPLRRRPRLGT